MHRLNLRLYTLILAAVLALNGQDFRATIMGRVTDPSGAAVPGAQVTAVQRETNAQSRSQTTDTGDYVISFLAPGEYRLEIERTGFRKSVQEGIVLRVGDRVSVDSALQVGQQAEQVTVTAEVPLLEASSASLGEVIARNTVADMPLNGRNPFSLIQFVPGAMSAGRQTYDFFQRLTATTGVSGLTVGGSPTASSEVLLDGVPLTDNRDVEMYTPSVNVTQEFKVQTNTFDAEVGRFLGAVVNVSTKSGTNEFHGELDEFLRNSALNARDFFAPYKPKFAYNQFAASAGGPLSIPGIYRGKNRTFVFGSYEGSREGVPRSFVSTVPTELERRGDFTQSYTRLTGGQAASLTMYDPATTRQSGSAFVRDVFPGNVIPSSRLNPVAVKVAALMPLPSATGDAVTHANNFPLTFTDPVRDDGFLVKLDHRFSDRHQVFGRVSYRFFDVYGMAAFNNNLTGSHNLRYIPGFAFDDTYTLNARTVLNFRYGFQRMLITYGVNLANLDLTTLGLPAELSKLVDIRGFPSFAIAGYTSFGSSAREEAWNTHSWHAGILTHFASHSIRAGADVRVGDTLYGPGGTSPGTYSFNNGFTRGPNPQVTSLTAGSGMASFLLGAGASGSLNYLASYAERVPYYGFYFQDDVRLTSKLTVNLGIRYEWESGHTERFNRMNRGFDIAAASPIETQALAKYTASPIPELPASQFRVKGGLLFAGVNGAPRAVTSIDRNNISPRAGVAWRLNPKTVFRAGWGLFYGPTSNQDVTRYGFTTSTTWVTTMDAGNTPFDLLSNPFPKGATLPSGANLGLATLLGQSVGFVDVNRRQLYAQRFQFSIQRQLPGQVLAEAAYVGMRGADYSVSSQIDPVPEQFRAQARATFVSSGRNTLNDVVANPFSGLIGSGVLSGSTTTRGQLLQPYPQFTAISKFGLTAGSSRYESFQLKVSKRLTTGLSLLLGYTASKSIERTSFLNPTDTVLDRSLSAFDIPQRVVFSGSYELPFGKGRSFGAGWNGLPAKLAEGWQANWNYTAQSGIPLVVTNAETVGSSAKISTGQRTLQRWFDTSAFRLRQTLELVGTRVLPDVRTQGRNNIGLSLTKDTSVTERVKLQFRAESFNLFNRTEFANPNATLGSAAFGTVSGQINFARQIQLGLRLTW